MISDNIIVENSFEDECGNTSNTAGYQVEGRSFFR